MLPMLRSVLFLLSFAVPGDATASPHLDHPTLAVESAILSLPSIDVAPETDPNRPVDVLFEPESDEEDDAPNDEVILDDAWTFRASISARCPGELRTARGTRRPIDRSPILRC